MNNESVHVYIQASAAFILPDNYFIYIAFDTNKKKKKKKKGKLIF